MSPPTNPPIQRKRTFRAFPADSQAQPLLLVEKLIGEGKLDFWKGVRSDDPASPLEEDEGTVPHESTPAPAMSISGSQIFPTGFGGARQLDPEEAIRIDIAKVHKELEVRARTGRTYEESTRELSRRLGMYLRKYPTLCGDLMA